MLIKLFETFGAVRIKYRLRKSKIFLGDESGDIYVYAYIYIQKL